MIWEVHCFRLFQLLLNLTRVFAVALLRSLSNFRALRSLQHPFSRHRDLKRFGDMTPYRLVNIIVYRVGMPNPRSWDKDLYDSCAPAMGACFIHSLIVCARISPVRFNHTWYKRDIKQSIPFVYISISRKNICEHYIINCYFDWLTTPEVLTNTITFMLVYLPLMHWRCIVRVDGCRLYKNYSGFPHGKLCHYFKNFIWKLMNVKFTALSIIMDIQRYGSDFFCSLLFDVNFLSFGS